MVKGSISSFILIYKATRTIVSLTTPEKGRKTNNSTLLGDADQSMEPYFIPARYSACRQRIVYSDRRE